MLYRILGLIIGALLITVGAICINMDRFGPQLTGYGLILVGTIIMTVTFMEWLEQTVNKLKGDAVEAQLSQDYWTKRDLFVQGLHGTDQDSLIQRYMSNQLTDANYAEIGAMCRQDAAELKALNTPDPHLIHPDDAKREARARLNIKV